MLLWFTLFQAGSSSSSSELLIDRSKVTQRQPYILPLHSREHHLSMWFINPEGDMRFSINPTNASTLSWEDWDIFSSQEFLDNITDAINLSKKRSNVLPDVFNLTDICKLPAYAQYCTPGAIVKNETIIQESELCTLPTDSVMWDEWCVPKPKVVLFYNEEVDETRWNIFPNVFSGKELLSLFDPRFQEKVNLLFENIED
jgi:hypothetical protein